MLLILLPNVETLLLLARLRGDARPVPRTPLPPLPTPPEEEEDTPGRVLGAGLPCL